MTGSTANRSVSRGRWQSIRSSSGGRRSPDFQRDEFLFLQMCLDFLQRGPTLKIELQHLPGSLGRLTSRPQDDEQAGDQGGVDLQGNAVLRCRQELLTAKDAFQPAEKQFPRPLVTISQSDQLGGQVQLVGEQPPRLQLALVVGALYLDQSKLVPSELVFVMRRAQAFQPLVTGDACRTIGRGEGALRLRRIIPSPENSRAPVPRIVSIGQDRLGVGTTPGA